MDYPLFYIDFWIFIIGKGYLDHGESKNRGSETLEFNLRSPGPKNTKMGQNLTLFGDFSKDFNQIDHEES